MWQLAPIRWKRYCWHEISYFCYLVAKYLLESSLKQDLLGLMEIYIARPLLLRVLIGCLVAAIVAAQTPTQLKVFRGTLVHSRVRTEMEMLEDYLIGINEGNYGTVSCRNHGIHTRRSAWGKFFACPYTTASITARRSAVTSLASTRGTTERWVARLFAIRVSLPCTVLVSAAFSGLLPV